MTKARISKWDVYPAKRSTCTELRAHYKTIVEVSKSNRFFKRIIWGTMYYFAGARESADVRQFVAANYMDCGFKVKIIKNEIWVKKK